MSEHVVRFPNRPAVPLSLWALLVACLSISAVMRLSFEADRSWLAASLALSVGCAVACACALAALQHRGAGELRGSALALLLVASVAWAAGSACGLRQRGVVERLSSVAVSSMSFVVTSDVSQADHGLRCRATALVEGIALGDVWLTGKSLAPRGTGLGCVGRFSPLSNNEYGISSWRQGVCGSVLVVRVTETAPSPGFRAVILALRERVLAMLEPQRSEGRALVAACVCGSRTALDGFGLPDVFSACGIAHLVAVSGAHLALLASLMTCLLDGLGLPRGAKIALLAALLGLFVLFCGAPTSAVRAFLMALSAHGAQLAGRRAHALSAACVAALAMALVDATVVGQLGYQLSVLSVIGLCLLSPHANYLVRQALPLPALPRVCGPTVSRAIYKAHEGLCGVLAVTLVCQLVTLPLTATVFGRLSLVAPLANLVAAPLMSLTLGLGLAACCLMAAPPAAQMALGACDLLTRPLLLALRHLSLLPFASVSTSHVAGASSWVSPLVVVVWVLWWPKAPRRALCRALAAVALVAVALIAKWRLLAPARIVVLDIGQGDAILVQDGPAAVLVDTGPDEAVVAALARCHVLHLDAVVVTHLHDDHYGGLDDLVGSVGCGQVLVARGVAAAMGGELDEACRRLTGAAACEIAYGDELRVGGFTLRMVWPQTCVDGDENCESIELFARYAGATGTLTALLTGDAEQDETGACLAAGDIGDIDLLKVGHHGSEVSIRADEARALAPELAVASAGEGNDYGHPRQECVEVLEGAGATFLCTKDVGDVEVRPGREGPVVYTHERQ